MSSKPTSFSMQDVIDSVGQDPNFQSALPFVLNHEGMVLEDVPGDPGGATLCGITHFDYDQYRHEHGLPLRSLAKATAREVGACYREHYWQHCQCSKVAFPLALTLFDTAVLLGSSRAIRWLQIELGAVVDGVIGQNTLAATGIYIQVHGVQQLAIAVIEQRRSFHRAVVASRPALKKFLQGWLNRCDDLQAAIADTAVPDPPEDPTPDDSTDDGSNGDGGITNPDLNRSLTVESVIVQTTI